MKALVVVMALASVASAEPIDSAIRARLSPAIPADLGIAEIHLPRSLVGLEVDRGAITVELPRAIRAGRASIKLGVPRRSPVYVPVTFGKLTAVAVVARELAAGATITDDDLTIEHRAVGTVALANAVTLVGSSTSRTLKAGTAIAATDVVLPRPLARGTQITVEMRRGGVRIRGTATLETAARHGEPASARLAHTRSIVRGTLRGNELVIEGPSP
jgi:flagella basal body P-ring formation protein FlgA